MSNPQVIELTEYQPTYLNRNALPLELGELLWRNYHQQVAVEFPSPKTGNRWQLASQGWVGHIPLSPDVHLSLQPKVALGNLFRMLEYAYNLDFKLLPGLVDSQSLAEFYERLAHILARRVLDRGRKGFYRAYIPQNNVLPYIRCRLDMRQVACKPGQLNVRCHYQEHTPDVDDNGILAWTLWQIARSGSCTERVLPTVRQAYRTLQGLVTPQPYTANACVGRQYHRLNADYQPLHALCRFFLEQSGPGHQLGNRKMVPFLVNMAALYEKFVATWLVDHLPPEVRLRVQERVVIGKANGLHFEIDLVLYSFKTNAPLCVLDTKYKTPIRPATDDIQQMISYAHTKGCPQAILIYPTQLAQPFDETVRNISLRAATFGLDGDLEEAGRAFLRCLPALNVAQ